MARITKTFTRELHHTSNPRRDLAEEVALTPEDDDVPEEIGSLHYDLAGPLVEEFLLAIDPYPRAPGAAFEPPAGTEDKPPNPFAALKTLK